MIIEAGLDPRLALFGSSLCIHDWTQQNATLTRYPEKYHPSSKSYCQHWKPYPYLLSDKWFEFKKFVFLNSHYSCNMSEFLWETPLHLLRWDEERGYFLGTIEIKCSEHFHVSRLIRITLTKGMEFFDRSRAKDRSCYGHTVLGKA